MFVTTKVSLVCIYGMFSSHKTLKSTLTIPLFLPSLSLSAVPPMIQTVYPEPDQTSYTVNETETVTFECSATGIPGPDITWSRNGVELSGLSGLSVSVNNPIATNINRSSDGENVWLVNRTLQLTNTEDADSGTYICNATNSAGDDYRPFELIVQSKLLKQTSIFHQMIEFLVY